MTDPATYTSALATRYASPAMVRLWGDAHRAGLWRRLWLALAVEERRLGLDTAERALAEVTSFRAARGAGLEAAVAATHLRAAATALEDLIGLVTSDDVLDRVFSAFCVGK